MENIIERMLEEEIKKTLDEVAQAKTGTEEAKAALTKLEKLHQQRIKEREQELKADERVDQRYRETKEFELRSKEFEQKINQTNMEYELKTKELAQKLEQSENEFAIRQAELQARIAQNEADISVKERELEDKDEELKEAKRTRRWRTAVEIITVTVPAALGGYWMGKGLQFEEEGKIYTSRTLQWVSQHLRFWKK